MSRLLFFVLLVACNAEHSLTSSELEEAEQTADQTANRQTDPQPDPQPEISQSSQASMSYQQASGGCSDRDLGTFVAESYVRYTVNPTVANSKTLAGNRKLRHTVTMEHATGREEFTQPSRRTYGERFLVTDGTVNGDNTEFTLEHNPLGGQGCSITVHNYRNGGYVSFFCMRDGVRADGRTIKIKTSKLSDIDTINIYYKENIRVPFQRQFQLQGEHINADTIRVNNRDRYFAFNAETKTLSLRGPRGDWDWQNWHRVFEGTKMVITYGADQLSYDLAADASVFNLARTQCLANGRTINCTVSNGKVHFRAADFRDDQQVVVSLQLRTTRKIPIGENYVEGSVVLTFDGNTCTDDDDQLIIDDDNNVLIDTDEAKSACSMLADFDDNDESITVKYKTFTLNQDKLIIESGFFTRHEHNRACYELWVNDTELDSDSYNISTQHSAVSPTQTDPPQRWLPFDAEVVLKVFLLLNKTAE